MLLSIKRLFKYGYLRVKQLYNIYIQRNCIGFEGSFGIVPRKVGLISAMLPQMDHRWLCVTVISLTLGTLVSSQWPVSLLQSPVTCRVGYNHRTCLTDVKCMEEFITCTCLPDEVIVALKSANGLPLDSDIICLYSIYVMEIGEPTCCNGRKRSMAPPSLTQPSNDKYWQFMVGRHFPLPSFYQKKEQEKDIIGSESSEIAKKSDTLHDLLDNLKRALKEEIISEAIENVDRHADDANKVNDIGTAISNVNSEIRHLLYKLLSVADNEKKDTDDKQ